MKDTDQIYDNFLINYHNVNATQLCQAGGKKFSHWFSLDSTKELINELSAEAGIPVSGLVETNRGGNNKSEQGSWIHPDLSISHFLLE